jgi:hypothetical protein
MGIQSHYVIVCQAYDCFHVGVSIFRAMAGDPNDEDDTFRFQATKEVWFMNQDLQERGFECLVEHHALSA